MRRSLSTPVRLFVLCALLTVIGCNSLEFRNVNVVNAVYDEESGATRVTVTFEVWKDDEPVAGLDDSAFTAYEDGIRATSESFAETDREVVRVPVILLLDTSKSMYDAGAMDDLKQAAQEFVHSLMNEGFDVYVYSFAKTVNEVKSIDKIPSEWEGISSDERWTSLYLALRTALQTEALIVVFSDGADNYSHNAGIEGVDTVEEVILADERIVHTIGFGNVRDEEDRFGVAGEESLRRIARFGSFNYAESAEGLREVFEDVSRRFRNIYSFDYFSPSLTGEHELVLEVEWNGDTAETDEIPFSSSGSGGIAVYGPFYVDNNSDEIYEVSLAAGGTVEVQLNLQEGGDYTFGTDSGLDLVMYLFDQNNNEIGYSDDVNGLDPAITMYGLAPGTYYLDIRGFSATTAGSFDVFVESD